jgi:uncharacterized protein (TIGR03083 family)
VAVDERAAFSAAAGWFLSSVDTIGGKWADPGLGEWTVRDLVGHASRSLVTVEDYLDAEPGEVTVPSALAYYLVVRAAATGPAVTERGRQAGAAMGTDPVAFLGALAERVLKKVEAAADDAFVATIAGGMRLIDYLPTRTFELVVHTADLGVALDVVDEPPAEAAASALLLAGLLVRENGATADVLLALTGRRPLPTGFTVL